MLVDQGLDSWLHSFLSDRKSARVCLFFREFVLQQSWHDGVEGGAEVHKQDPGSGSCRWMSLLPDVGAFFEYLGSLKLSESDGN